MHSITLNWSRPQFTYGTTPSYALAVMGFDTSCLDWIYSHYVNMHIRDIGQMTVDPEQFFDAINILQVTAADAWGGVSLLTYTTLRKHKLGLMRDSLFEYIYDALFQGKYIFTYVNFKGYTMGNDYLHNILIHGIDFDKRRLLVLGFKDDIYGSYPIDFDLFGDMFFSEYADNMQKNLILFSRNNTQYAFNETALITQINDYLSSRISLEYFDYYFHESERSEDIGEESNYDFVLNAYKKGGFSYGIEASSILGGYIRYYLSDSTKAPVRWFDLRSFRCFMDHKLIMSQRWSHISSKGYLGTDLSEISQSSENRALEAQILFNVLTKMKVSKRLNNDKLLQIEDKINTIVSEEAHDLETLISKL